MAVFSTLMRSLARNVNLPKNGTVFANQVSLLRSNTSANAWQILRQMSGHGHRTMAIKPSRWQWNKFKDLLHFYIMLGVIPSTLVILYLNIFIGPAKLAAIPEGYVPESHEYHAHPITRWMAKYVSRSYQQEYEVMCHHLYEEEYKQKLRLVSDKLDRLKGSRRAYQMSYFYITEKENPTKVEEDDELLKYRVMSIHFGKY
uniref:NADH dehydrogenase [ubiquinone] 1 beta subcomplex subunit 5, mitochondrial n=1 Tax=Ceriodaphnia reticulata TaxID=302197 RepID=A0A4Y7LUZ0_9CRUS|nr:EOG090X0FIE [Ceriodaphnia reticulata]SVE73247.1 EOG090X0FIE [Ceriodaphnia reticulata]